MNPKLLFPLVLAGALLATPARAQTNSAAITNNDAVVNGYLQIQEQLHATQMAIADIRAAAADDAKRNAETIATRLEALEQSVAAQRNADAEAARRTQQLTLLLAAGFGLAGLGIMALMFYFQWRAFTKIAEISAQQNAALANAGAVHQLVGRAQPGDPSAHHGHPVLSHRCSRHRRSATTCPPRRRLRPPPPRAGPARPSRWGRR